MDDHPLPPFATAVIEASSEPALVIDESGKVVLWNAHAAALFGYEELAAPPQGSIHVDQEAPPALWRRLSTAKTEPVPLRARHRDGAQLALSLITQTIAVAAGHSFVIALARPEGGGKFLKLASPFEQALASMRDYLLMLDIEGRIRFANGSFLEDLQIPSTDLIGRRWTDLVAKSSHPALLEQIRRAALDQGRFGGEICFAARDGREIWVRIFASRMDRSGAPKGLVVLLTNITRGRAEEKLRGEFAANVSHELRTPLASVKGFTSTILNDPAMPEATRREFLEIIEAEADRLSALIDDLLDYSRLESGHFEMHLKQVDLGDVLDRVLAILKPQIQNKSIKLRTSKPSESAPLLGDSARLIQILQNIIGNAIKYTPSGGSVDVALTEHEAELRCEVRDTGIGIAAEEIPLLFSKFFRGREAQRQSGGTGLGLSIAKGLVEQHGGSIAITSQKGRGTAVVIRLPRDHAAVKQGAGSGH
jgi:two-component system phosphate regulon sensor histidine kinase PhoR